MKYAEYAVVKEKNKKRFCSLSMLAVRCSANGMWCITFLMFTMLSLFISNELIAQSLKIDSLERLVKNAGDDTSKLRLYSILSKECEVEDNPKYATPLIELADQLLARKISTPEKKAILKYKAFAYGIMLYYYRQTGDSSKILECYNKSLSIYKAINDREGIISCNANIAAYYDEQGNIAKELACFQEGLSDSKRNNDKQGIAIYLSALSRLYEDQGELGQALLNSREALLIYNQLKDTVMVARTFRNLGQIYSEKHDTANAMNCYRQAIRIYEVHHDMEELRLTYNMMGFLFAENNDDANAIRYFEKSSSISTVLPDKTFLRANLGNIGDIHRKNGNLAKALEYHYKALSVARDIHSQAGQIGWVWFQLAKDYLALKECKTAKKYIDSFMLVTLKVPGLNDSKMDGELVAARIDSCNGYFREAYLHFQQYNYWRDKLNSDEVKRAAIKQNFQHDYDRKKAMDKAEQYKMDMAAKERIRQQQIIRNSLLGVLALVILFALTVLRQRNKIKLEQQRSEELLLNILPAETAEELKNTGAAKARNFNEVTVMFTDFKNFSHASEKLSAEELVHEINHLYSSFDTIISAHHIEKIKTIGDSYMAASGLPVENKTHAEDTVRAALEILNFIDAYNEQKSTQGKPPFEIRIGIHTGPVVAGIVGIKKFAYDIWGDTVNIASRMESSGEAGKINISGTTYDIVKNQFNCVHRGKIEAKNKGEIEMYFVTNHLQIKPS